MLNSTICYPIESDCLADSSIAVLVEPLSNIGRVSFVADVDFIESVIFREEVRTRPCRKNVGTNNCITKLCILCKSGIYSSFRWKVIEVTW